MANSNRPTPSQIRLQAALKKEVLAAGNYLELQQELQTVVRGELAKSIDRRKLKRLAETDDDVPLTFSELHALDTFLRRKGHGGLFHIFRSTDLLQAVSELQNTTFFLGFKAVQDPLGPRGRTWISHWDLRSATVLLQGLYRFHTSLRLKVELKEVMLGDKPKLADFATAHWYDIIAREEQKEEKQDSQALFAIGSPKACHASEILLAKMFGIEPFQPRSKDDGKDLPFQFEWTVEQLEKTPSSFAYAERSAWELPREFEHFTSFSVQFDGQSFQVPWERDRWQDYGVVVAQRRQNGNIWVVCAGLSGPATLASARLLAKESVDLAPSRADQSHSDPVCFLVECNVEKGASSVGGDPRVVMQEHFQADTERADADEERGSASD